MSVNKVPVVVSAKQATLAAARRTDSVYAYYVGYITGGSSTVFIGDASAAVIKPETISPSIGDSVPATEDIVYDKGFVRKNEML